MAIVNDETHVVNTDNLKIVKKCDSGDGNWQTLRLVYYDGSTDIRFVTKELRDTFFTNLVKAMGGGRWDR